MVSPLTVGRSGRLPVTVVGGYLGAGKTTLINRLLADPNGVKLAVIVNDFGSVNIDAALIASRDGETVSLTNGCVCCTMGDNLALTLHEFADRNGGPEHVVIEASGVADPEKVAGYAASHPRLVLDGVVVVADVETVRERADDKYVGDLVRRQLAAADLILLGKTDLVAACTSRQVDDWISSEVPDARVVTPPATGQVADLLLAAVARRSPLSRPAPDARHARLFATWTFASRRLLDEAALRRAIGALPASVVRAKGIVTLAGESGRRFVFQLAGRRWTLEPEVGTTSPALPERSVIVFIGLAERLKPAHLEMLFAGTVSMAMPPAVGALLRPEGRR